MKRYMLFLFESAYPGGGVLDFDMDFDSIDEVADYLREKAKTIVYKLPIWHIFDIENRSIVACSAYFETGGYMPNEVRPESSYGGTSGDIENSIELSTEAELVTDILSWRVN